MVLKMQDLWKSVKDRRRVAAPEKFYLIFSSIIIRLIIDLTFSFLLFVLVWFVRLPQVWNRTSLSLSLSFSLLFRMTWQVGFVFVSFLLQKICTLMRTRWTQPRRTWYIRWEKPMSIRHRRRFLWAYQFVGIYEDYSSLHRCHSAY